MKMMKGIRIIKMVLLVTLEKCVLKFYEDISTHFQQKDNAELKKTVRILKAIQSL